MSLYLFEHPAEAYKDEVKCLKKAFNRRRTKLWMRQLLLLKTYAVYLYRKGRYGNYKRKLTQESVSSASK